MRALSLGGSRRGSSTVTHPCLGRGFLLALLARSLTTDARFGEILESLGGFRAGWSLGTIRRHGPGEVLAMGSCWDVPPTLGQSSPAPARSPASPSPSPSRSLSPPSRRGPPPGSSLFSALCGLGWGLASGWGSGLWSSSPLFPASPYVLAHALLLMGPVSRCTCLLSLVFQLAAHLLASFYLRFAGSHSSEGCLIVCSTSQRAV